MGDIFVSINVLHYNSFEKSKVCIDSCLQQTGINFIIYVIDNNSSNDSLNELKKVYFGENKIIFIENSINYGFAKGNNEGVKYALSQGIKYSLLLNNDTELTSPHLLATLYKSITSNSNCGVVAPYIFNVTRNGLELNPNSCLYLKLLERAGIMPSVKIIDKTSVTVNEAQGSALFVDNTVFLKIGGFPEHYFMYGEESTFSKRLIWANYSILWYKSKETIIHHHHDKTGRVAPWRLYLMGRNRAIEYMENKKKSPTKWAIIYHLFYLYMLFKGESIYLQGMNDGKMLVKKNKSKEDIYQQALLAQKKYI